MSLADATSKEINSAAEATVPDMQDPSAVLSVLEADQIVAAKQQTRFGRRKLSRGTRALLWALRVYVVIMLVLVVISAFRVIHPSP
ncbi:MAG TPA: hypothetical protein VMB47_10025 [Candidatus Aquilonibacter sp.]|nr:hypothetical protein [Candidatus Aquilonibacter sp.]